MRAITMYRGLSTALAATVLTLALAGCTTPDSSETAAAADPRINQIQVLGTHNSYSLGVDPALLAALGPVIDGYTSKLEQFMKPEQIAEFREYHPNTITWAEGLNYRFPEGLTAQLDAGLRSLEIDVNRDPEGGRFLEPAGYAMLKSKGVSETAFLPHDRTDLEKPGFKVFHMTDIDFRSSCNLLTRCLGELKTWSDANPGHAPIFILMEAKDQSLPLLPNPTKVLPFDEAAYNDLDAEIVASLGRDRIITPDDIRGDHATLEAAVRAGAWPRLSVARGKFVFLLLTAIGTDGLSAYRAGRPNLEGRVAFLRSTPGESHAAFLLLDNATMRQQDIQQRVKEGYLVRARADIETYEAKANDHARAAAAFSSGAQIVSTDFYKPGNGYGTDYVVTLPGGKDWRCNPVNAPDCATR
jgi:hypothetical protein